MSKLLTFACIQTNSGDDMAANIDAIAKLVAQAAEARPVLAALPENAFRMQAPGERGPYTLEDAHPGVIAAKGWAKEYGMWLLIGSAAVLAEEHDALPVNRSLLLDPCGEVTARYDKLHLFDVTLPSGETYAESAKFGAGRQAVTAATPFGRLGMTICYDVRFPQLYRALAQRGADVLAVPAAFTYTTGSAHWHVLNRARAIENGCFVLAPAQCGMHPGKRRTFGHSLIIGPWGEILAEGSEETPGVITAALDMEEVARVRAQIPSLSLERKFEIN